jgi:hypothetical protein
MTVAAVDTSRKRIVLDLFIPQVLADRWIEYRSHQDVETQLDG